MVLPLVSFIAFVSCGSGDGTAPIAVTGVAVEPKEISVAVGATRKLAVTVAPPDATDRAVSWRSSDDATAAVRASGAVTGVAVGAATITVATRDGGKTDACSVTVTAAPVPVADVVIPWSLELAHGGYPNTGRIVGWIEPHDATNTAVAWTNSHPEVASLAPGPNAGMAFFGATIVALSAGTTVVTVTTDDGGKTAECLVEVTEEPDVLGQEWGLAANADVYIVGWGNRLFKNGVTTRLLYEDPPFRRGYAVFVSGGDVHVAGEVQDGDHETYAMHWKNGAALALGDGGTYSYARDMFVSGDDVYIAGSWEGFYPTLWVNGERRILGGSTSFGAAYAVFVSGADVYVGGNDTYGGAIWKNGVRRGVGAGGRYACVQSIFVSGEDVYAAVFDWVGHDRAWLYKNGEFTLLGEYASPSSVAVSGGDVYVLGNETTNKEIPVVWKNGVKQPLTDGSMNAWGNSMAVSGGDVYVTGSRSTGSGPSIPTLWINGEAVDLRPSGLQSAVGIFVVEKGGRAP